MAKLTTVDHAKQAICDTIWACEARVGSALSITALHSELASEFEPDVVDDALAGLVRDRVLRGSALGSFYELTEAGYARINESDAAEP